MKKVPVVVLVLAVVVSLIVGGIGGFVLGIAATKAGKVFLQGMFEEEKTADVSSPKTLNRHTFELQYPSNWHVAKDDKDYDPDHMFSIDSPGDAFVMCVIGTGDTDPETNLQIQIRHFEKLISSPSIDRFDRYGQLTGKGAQLKGKIMGIRMTVRVFACHQNGQTVMITQHCPDEDLKRVQDGLNLIESSFMLRTTKKDATTPGGDAGT